MCALGAFGFFKTARAARAVSKAVRSGMSLKEAVWGGFAGLFCWDLWENLKAWDLCTSGGTPINLSVV